MACLAKVDKTRFADDVTVFAGASKNNGRMWEKEVNSFEEGKGYGAMALMELIKEVQNTGRVSFADTTM